MGKLKSVSFSKRNILKKVVFLLMVVLFVVITLGQISNYLAKTKIDRVLKSSSYAYLSKEAKNYIKEVYEKTGNVVLTEKNKKENVPYLNPGFIQYLEMTDEEKKLEGVIPYSMITDYTKSSKVVGDNVIPDSFDSRNVDNNNYVTPNRDQGNLGLCWAFSTTSVFESYLMKKNNSPYSANTQLFSERQIDYATAYDGIVDYESEYVSFIERYLGDGGNFYVSTVAMANGVSLVDYDWKEYNDTDFSEMELYEVLNYDNSMYEVNSTVNMPYLDFKELDESEESENLKTNFLNEIKNNIMKNGSAYVATYYNDRCFYTDTALNNTVVDVDDYCASYGGGHALTVIGWDDNIEYDYCADTSHYSDDISNCSNVVTGKGVWILKNSWGEEYDPYPYLTYDSSYSSFHFITGATKTSERSWDNNYVVGSNLELTSSVNYLYDMGIVDSEKLNAIKFISLSSNSTYSIEILTADGTYETYSASSVLPGLITLDLSSENILINDDSLIFIDGGEYYFADNVSVFTNNLSSDMFIDLSGYEDLTISDNEIRMYSVTKNIPSNTKLVYKLLDENNNDVSSKIVVSNNIVAENNINPLISAFSDLESGEYTLSINYNDEEIGSISLYNFQMDGSGTEEDPYIIMNSSHLNQIRYSPDSYYVLGSDIDLSEDTYYGGKFYNESSDWDFLGGHGWEPINDFSGTFDGQGYTISGLYQTTYMDELIGDTIYISRFNDGIGGLFGTLTGNVTIKNLILEDFDITCHKECGILAGQYVNYDSSNNFEVNFTNIAVKNSVIDGIRDYQLRNNIYVGGVFGSLSGTSKGNLNISNIYVETNILPSSTISYHGELAWQIDSFKNIDINNIQLLGMMEGKYDGGSDSGLLAYQLSGYDIDVQNVLSTVYHEKIGGNLLRSSYAYISAGDNPQFTIKNLNMLKIPNRELVFNTDDGFITVINTNLYDLDNTLDALTNQNNYSNWENFNNNWVMQEVDGVKRYPVLKFVDFEYTNILDITIEQKLNWYYNIYDYVTPDIDINKRLTYSSNDESIVKIDEDGSIIPQSSGTTTLHVENLYYDGYKKDVPITIEYAPHYVVNYDSNGGEGEVYSLEVAINENHTVDENYFYRDKYIFNGWNTKADGTGTSYSEYDVIKALGDKESITLYAQWLGEEFEITFDANGGTTLIASKKVRYGETYGELPIPVRDGYGFEEWQIDGDGWVKSITSDDDVHYSYYNPSLIAKWVSDAYTVAFYPNGGNGISTWMNIKNNTDGTLIENTYTRDGYVFTGWNTKEDGSGVSYLDQASINLDSVENSLLNLYAQWQPIEYDIVFNANDGVGSIDKIDVTFDVSVNLPVNTFTREGYVFNGWNTKEDGTGVSYSDQASVKNLANKNNQEVILYAQWDAITYKVVFNNNGGTGTMEDQVLVYDKEFNLNANTFTKEDYKFVQWNTKNDGTGTSYSDKASVKNLTTEKDGEVVLYAIWREVDGYVINEYSSDEESGYVSLIPGNTSLDAYKENIILKDGYSVEVDLGERDKIFTGSKTKIYKDSILVVEFINVVSGDVTGDGIVNIADVIKIADHSINQNVLVEDYEKLASDVTKDSVINIADVVKIADHTLDNSINLNG